MVIGFPKVRKSALLLTGGMFLLTACGDGFDLGSLGQKLDRRPAVNTGAQSNTAPRPKPDSRGLITYPNYQVIIARHNDTMSEVAGRIGMSGPELARFNGLPANYMPRAGEVLALPKGAVIPVETTGVGAGSEPQANSLESIAQTAIGRAGDTTPQSAVQAGPEPIRHVVEPGETIYSIARLYRVSVPSLASWNGLAKTSRYAKGSGC